MPTAFHPWTIRELPERQRFGTSNQYHLRMHHRESHEDASSTAQLEQANYRSGVDRYLCEHDYLTKLKYPGRALGIDFLEYITPYKFGMYILRDGEGEWPLALVKTKDPVARDFIKRMNEHPEFLAVERMVDFNLLRPRVEVITGAWFDNMRSTNLSSTGVFGTRVDRSDEFGRAERHGRLKTLMVVHRCGPSNHLLTITQSGTVVTFAGYETEEAELDVVLDFKRGVLDHCWEM